jgi:membrane-associated PAP2 superfamily phosphatase
MKKNIVIFFFISVLSRAENMDSAETPIPFLNVFDGILLNSGKSFIYNYGFNTALMAAGTYTLVQTEVDWKWRQLSYEHESVAYAGTPAVMTGGVAPLIVPLSLYGIGRYREDLKLQTASVAVAQSVIISTVLTTGIKTFTSRRPPDVWGSEKSDEKKDFSNDFKFGFLKRVPFDGWPSGHTSAAWAMAATLTEFYPENIPLAIGLYSYALYVGLGVSVTIHWLSDAWAGALFGYAIGKTVAQHFIEKDSRFSIVVQPNGFMLVWAI